MAVTGATVGMAHWVRAPLGLPVTSCVEGSDNQDALGQVVMAFDEALAVAKLGRIVLARPNESLASNAISARLGSEQPLAGVAMLPILQGDGVLGMVELARADHMFRAGDAKALTRIAFAAAAQLAS
jgi:hypothetical protein